MQKITVSACANIALIKYWGKRDESLFLPTKSSISITIPHLTTTTTIMINPNHEDRITLNTKPVTLPTQSTISQFLNIFRTHYQKKDFFIIDSHNNFPTAAGLASSASGFAALAKGLNVLYSLNLSPKELSILARQGSGSACRSIEEGFVLWHKGVSPNGSDSYAEKLFPLEYWPDFTVLVVLVDTTQKTLSSRIAMQKTIKTSPFYSSWIEQSEKRITPMINAIAKKDFATVGALAEQDCLAMHQCMQTSNPSINYWNPHTITIMNLVSSLRTKGIPCYFTIDAGPNVKILTLAPHANLITQQLKNFAILSQ